MDYVHLNFYPVLLKNSSYLKLAIRVLLLPSRRSFWSFGAAHISIMTFRSVIIYVFPLCSVSNGFPSFRSRAFFPFYIHSFRSPIMRLLFLMFVFLFFAVSSYLITLFEIPILLQNSQNFYKMIVTWGTPLSFKTYSTLNLDWDQCLNYCLNSTNCVVGPSTLLWASSDSDGLQPNCPEMYIVWRWPDNIS